MPQLYHIILHLFFLILEIAPIEITCDKATDDKSSYCYYLYAHDFFIISSFAALTG